MLGRQFMRDNLGIRAAAIAVTMVAIMVRIDNGIDFFCRFFRVAIGGQHGFGQRHIEQCVDQ